MLEYKGLEHYDKFDSEVVCWVDVSNVPYEFIKRAKKIDRENYTADAFGVCMQYDTETKELIAVEDSPGYFLYYVDNGGDKHWFRYELDGQEMESFSQKLCPIMELL